MSVTIDVSDLRIGMFIHLDLSWMSHPFPLGSFKISSDEQIATIRSLGLKRLRWSPEKSDLPAPVQAVVDQATEVLAPPAFTEAEEAAQAEARARREALAEQREAQALCERQYGEASRAWKQMADLVPRDPAAARDQAQALSRALLDKMLGERELCVRLLTEGAGERATAHALNVGVVAMLMGKLFALTEEEMVDLGTGAMLHDIGKLDIPDRLRHADPHHTSAEQSVYREHVALGVAHGKKMGLTPGALLVIGQHHEQADGTGFPLKLNIDRMTAAARIVALVNRYDNLCNPHAIGHSLTPHEALSLMFSQGQKKFDATMLNAFIRMMGVYPPGSVVQLTDDRYAMVVTVNSSRPLKPRVLVHDAKVPRDEALLLDLEAQTTLGIRRSLKAAQLPAAAREYLQPGSRIAYFFEPHQPLREPEAVPTP
jgi:HD-GYP domain-containing protein (c-di-GMP phosphodiesterase class II)